MYRLFLIHLGYVKVHHTAPGIIELPTNAVDVGWNRSQDRMLSELY